MAKLVASINGAKVYSDKQVSSIKDTRITFTDRSWCDVRTGDVVNRGSGEIIIHSGGVDSEIGEKTTDTKTFEASNLTVDGIAAYVDVQVHDSASVVVTREGYEEELEDIRVTQDGATVLIHGTGSVHGGITVTSSRTGGRSSSLSGIVRSFFEGSLADSLFSSGSVTISSSGNASTFPKVTVKVPKGAAVSISGVKGGATIGDTQGPFSITHSSTRNVTVGRVTSAAVYNHSVGSISVREAYGAVNIESSGTGNIQFGKVTTEELRLSAESVGSITIQDLTATGVVSESHGTGSVSVNSGTVVTLVATSTSVGSFIFGGTTQTAQLRSSGTGRISVASVQKTLSSRQSSVGSVQVRAGAVEKLTVSISGTGSFNFKGVADAADLKTSSVGSINVNRVKTQPIQKRTGTGRINIGTIG